MSFEFSDAYLRNVLINVRDDAGRRASLEFKEDGIELRDRRPRQGKKAFITYKSLFDLVSEHNPKFFEAPTPRKKLG